MQLNNAQMTAVRHETGPALVLAGPGSGKTRVITERVIHLIKNCDIKPMNILVVTFTRAAAMEMKSRFEDTCNNRGVWFGTFHSLFFLILKTAYGYKASDILKEEDKRTIISEAIYRYDKESAENKEIVDAVIAEIGNVKSMRYDINSYYSLKCSADMLKYVYKSYVATLQKRRLIDFDDMMLYTYELLSARKDILAGWQNLFRYILIDEFQDINKLQYDIIKMLSEDRKNLFCVGDDDQSIYGFRGSDPSIMMTFFKDYPDAEKIILNVNYRCDGNIMNMASKLIKNNQVRMDKDIVPFKECINAVDIRSFDSANDEYSTVLDLVKTYLSEGVEPSEIAVLYRTNIQPGQLIHKLLEHNIDVRVKDGVPNIYNHFIARDILAYIKLALGYGDIRDFVQIMNKPKRYLSRDIMGMSVVDYDSFAALYEEKPWMVKRIYQMEEDINSLKMMKPGKGVRFIEKVIGYGDYLKEYAEYRNIDYDNLHEVLDTIFSLASAYDSYDDFLSAASEYEKWVREEDAANREGINLMTMHGSKGLEFKKVIIIDINEGIIPHKLSVKEEELEEERRMFYVGMTRAKEKLHLFYIKSRHSRNLSVSRFIEELIKEND